MVITIGSSASIATPLAARPSVKNYEAQELRRQEQLRRQRQSYVAQELKRREQLRQQAIAAEAAERAQIQEIARQEKAHAAARAEAARIAEIERLRSSITPPQPIRRNSWFTSSDYPKQAVKDERGGRVFYTVTVNSEGAVSHCEVSQSSGWSDLDQITCELIEKRARFIPAYDGLGTKVAAAHSGSQSWTLGIGANEEQPFCGYDGRNHGDDIRNRYFTGSYRTKGCRVDF
jgi:TonB family protein